MGTDPQEQGQDQEPQTHAGSTIPHGGQGVGLGASEDANTFEPEEDPEATADEE